MRQFRTRGFSLSWVRLLSAAAVCLSIVFSACSLGPKSGNGNGGTLGGGNGGTSTGNAVVRLAAYLPTIENGKTTQIRISINAIRAHRTGGGWANYAIDIDATLQPSGVDLMGSNDLQLPAGPVDIIELNLDRLEVENANGSFSLPSSQPMRFIGATTLGPSASIGLNLQPYGTVAGTAHSNAELASLWAATTSSIVSTEFGPRSHVLFTLASTVLTGSGVAGFDSVCQMAGEAGAIGHLLPSGKTWRALVSTTANGANTRVTLRGNIYNSNRLGQELLATATNFWNPAMDWEAAQDFDQTGEVTPTPFVWSSTSPNGTAATMSTCMDWFGSSSSSMTSLGNAQSQNQTRWIGSPATCDGAYSLYCMSE